MTRASRSRPGGWWALAGVTSLVCCSAACGTRPPVLDEAPAGASARSGDEREAPAIPESLPSREVDLAAWDVDGLDALRYARVGVVHSEKPQLVVYHLGTLDPERSRPVSTASAAPPLVDGAFVVGRYRDDNENRLGGHFNGFARAPARAVAGIEGEGEQRALTFTWERAPETFAGFWIHLFETHRTPAERVWFDARGFGWLTFEVRGGEGDEPIRLQAADRDMERKQDSLPVGPLGDFLPAGRVTAEWQRAWVPLSALPASLDRQRLANVVFLADPDGASATRGTLRVRELAFTEDEVPPPPAPTAHEVADRDLAKGMWLWETRRMLATEGSIEELVAFVDEHGFTDVFVQVPFESAPGEHWGARFDAAGLARMATALNRAGVRVHALDGAAWYARPEWHDRVMDTLGQLIRFNQTVDSEARLAGVRYDIEPYLLPEFEGHNRERVLNDYLRLLRRIVPAAHGAGLHVGVDIPFWFDSRDEVTGELTCAVGGRPASEAIIDLVDDVGIMDYRTMAWGADGVIAHASGELAYAERVGKRVLVGLETVPLPDETILVYDGKERTPWDVFGDLVVIPRNGTTATMVWVPASERRADGYYPWAGSAARLLRYRDAIEVPASKITFASLHTRDLQRTLERARDGLLHRNSLGGFIIHSYESFRPWLEANSAGSAQSDRRDAGDQPR